jgi:hypothetical protein
MKFRPTPRPTSHGNRARAGFTFAEVLAALLFMAIVLPVRRRRRPHRQPRRTGQRPKDRRPPASPRIISTNSRSPVSGNAAFSMAPSRKPRYQYRWMARVEPWTQIGGTTATLRLLTVEVFFLVQGREYDDPDQPPSSTPPSHEPVRSISIRPATSGAATRARGTNDPGSGSSPPRRVHFIRIAPCRGHLCGGAHGHPHGVL